MKTIWDVRFEFEVHHPGQDSPKGFTTAIMILAADDFHSIESACFAWLKATHPNAYVRFLTLISCERKNEFPC